MYEVLIVVYLLVAIGLVGLILIQQGKGADMGSSFGAGASGTLFGSSGTGNFLTRTTAVLAIGFFALSLTIGNLSANHNQQEDSWNNIAPGTQTPAQSQGTTEANGASQGAVTNGAVTNTEGNAEQNSAAPAESTTPSEAGTTNNSSTPAAKEQSENSIPD